MAFCHNRPHMISPSDIALLRRFESRTLPHEEWTHRTHVRVAYCYLARLPFESALDRLREGIKLLNEAHALVEGPTSGYNETTTRAFLHLIAATIAAYGKTFATVDADAFCDRHTQLMNRHVLRLFYSPERRMDPRAKTEFVEPDLAPLPRIVLS